MMISFGSSTDYKFNDLTLSEKKLFSNPLLIVNVLEYGSVGPRRCGPVPSQGFVTVKQLRAIRGLALWRLLEIPTTPPTW
jgi:hypothetical protein